jgi:hypothetical protein
MIKDQQILLYTDTSVISDIDADSERGEITREFFRIVAESPDEYKLVISPVTTGELDDSPDPKRTRVIGFLDNNQHLLLPEMTEAKKLASRYVAEGVLTETHINDLLHVAYATVAHCNYVVSWNMKHLVRVRTIERVNEVNYRNNLSRVIIAIPYLITGERNDVND